MFVAPAYAASVVRFPLGFRVSPLGPRPAERLELYDMEGCPFCRKVREAISMLDLEVLVKPCPKAARDFATRRSESAERLDFRS